MKSPTPFYKAMLGLVGLLALAVAPSHATDTISVNFNTATDVNLFNTSVIGTSGSDTYSANTGLGSTGCLSLPTTLPYNGTNDYGQIWTSKTGFTAPVGTAQSVSCYFYDLNAAGYGGLGFALANSNTPSTTVFGSYPVYVTNSLGVYFHGSGGAFTDGSTDTNYVSVNISQGAWYKCTLTMTVASLTGYNLALLIQASDANGTVGSTLTSVNYDNTTTNGLLGASAIYPYIMASSNRFSKLDNFSASGPAAVPEPSTYGLLLMGGIAGLTMMRRKLAAR